jgi:hypothetical protein
MRTWILDQDEFERPESEQSLEVNHAKRADKRAWQAHGRHAGQGKFRFSNVSAFAAKAAGKRAASQLPGAVPFKDAAPRLAKDAYFGEPPTDDRIRTDIQRLTGVEIPSSCDWPTYVLTSEWNDCEFILSAPDSYIRFRWNSSA